MVQFNYQKIYVFKRKLILEKLLSKNCLLFTSNFTVTLIVTFNLNKLDLRSLTFDFETPKGHVMRAHIILLPAYVFYIMASVG